MTSHNPPNETQRAIIRCLILAPKTENQLMELLQGKGIELAALRVELKALLADGTIAVTRKRFWLRGVTKAEVRKVLDDRQQKEKERYG